MGVRRQRLAPLGPKGTTPVCVNGAFQSKRPQPPWGWVTNTKLSDFRQKCLDGITDSMDMSLSKLQEIVNSGKPGMLQSMGSQRVRHDLETEGQEEASKHMCGEKA